MTKEVQLSIPKIVSILREDTERGPKFTITDTLRREKTVGLDSDVTIGILKPDAIVRRLGPKIYGQISRAGMTVEIIDNRKLASEEIAFLYERHIGAPYYNEIVAFMTSTKVEIFMAEGKGVVAALSTLIGSTDPKKSITGTIRRDYYTPNRVFPQFPNIYQNLIHSSDEARVAQELQHFLGVRSQSNK